MQVTNYDEWKKAVKAEISKLGDVSDYLNEKGTERYEAFSALNTLASFCKTAEELLAWIESGEDLDQREAELLRTRRASDAISSLWRIAGSRSGS